MELYYCDVRQTFGKPANFGDDLNLWLWPKLIPGFFERNPETLFIGIGTLLNERVPFRKETVVFGSGVGYGNGIPKLDDTWEVYCVRGPLSARRLGLPEQTAVTDGALLLRSILPAAPSGRKQVGFMPHFLLAGIETEAWKQACRELGIAFIDPTWPVERTIAALQSCELLLTEAMHGAIVADALRIPWIPLVTSRQGVFSFKWEDWCQSMNVEYNPVRIYPLQSLSRRIPRLLGSEKLTVWSLKLQLTEALRNARPQLSSEQVVGSRLDRLEELLGRLNRRLQQLETAGACA